MKKCVLALALLLMPRAWAANAIYRPPVDPYEANKLVKPSRPLPPPQFLSVSNLYDGGHFSGQRIDFKYNADGTFKRISTNPFDYLQEARFADCNRELTSDFIMNHIIHGSVMKRMDTQALDEMINIDYIDVEKKKHYLEGGHNFNPNQMINLDTSSVMTPAEVKSYFDGKIPWGRISEILAPRGWTIEQAMLAAEYDHPEIQLRLRRATLRLTSAQYLDPKMRSLRTFGPLPFNIDGSSYRINWNITPIAFEFGRLSQIVGTNREAQQLVAMGTAIAYMQTLVIDVIGWPQFPPQETKIFVQAKDEDHRSIYKSIAGFNHIPGAEAELMGASIDEAMQKLGRALKQETVQKIIEFRTKGRKPNWTDYLHALSWIQVHRESHLKLIDATWNGFPLTSEAPILFRSPPKLARKNTLARILNGNNDIKPHATEFMDILDEVQDFDFQFPWGSRPDDFANRDKVWEKFPNDYLISGLINRKAVDPLYVRKALAAAMKNLLPEWFQGSHFIVAARSEALRAQLAEFGEPVEGGYRMSFKDLQQKLAVDPEGIKDKLTVKWEGFWYRYWILKNLPGL